MHSEASYEWLEPVVIGVAAVAALALLLLGGSRLRLIAISTALVTLSVVPAAWAVDTLGHATSGTFPAGGPANAGGGPGNAGGFGGPGGSGGRGGFSAGGPPGAIASAGGIAGLFGSANSAKRHRAFGRSPAFARGFPGGGESLTPALRYIKAHGGGTLAVSSQTSAETAVIDKGAHVAGIGGFSGNESEVSASWLAQEVRSGKIRWVLDDDSSSGLGGGFGGISGGRVGSRDAMQWVSRACRRTTTVDGSRLYDCSGRAARIIAVAAKAS